MAQLEFTIAEKISLKNSVYNEDWLQARIAERKKRIIRKDFANRSHNNLLFNNNMKGSASVLI